MFKVIISISSIIILQGCTTTQNFFDVQATPIESSGYWTGQHNRLIATLKIDRDGTGVICQDALGTARILSVKKVNDRLYSQDGSYWKIQDETSDSMKLNYAVGGGYLMRKDQDLKLATPACLEKFNK